MLAGAPNAPHGIMLDMRPCVPSPSRAYTSSEADTIITIIEFLRDSGRARGESRQWSFNKHIRNDMVTPDEVEIDHVVAMLYLLSSLLPYVPSSIFSIN